MNPKLKKWLTFTVRWGIAVVGIVWVLAKLSFHDRLLVIDPVSHRPVSMQVLHDAPENSTRFEVIDPKHPSLGSHLVDRNQVWTLPDQSTVEIPGADGKPHKAKLLAVHPTPGVARDAPPDRLDVVSPDTGDAFEMDASRASGFEKISASHPLIDIGLIRLVETAKPLWFLLAMMVLPVSYIINSRRWHMLLEVLEIHIGQGRTFVLNMVGAFYNTFMPGSTGGDLIKAYYAAKHTTHRTRAIMSVIVDRVLGLLALILLGGVMSCFQLQSPECRRVALICGLIIFMTTAGLTVFYTPFLRRITGFDFFLAKMPLQRQLYNAIGAMELYLKKPGIPATAIVMTLPVHITTIISAYFAGQAFGLQMPFLYYWVIVPVIALVGALPLAPQGAGVMEVFAVALTKSQGVTASQAIALAMSIRVGQMFWNLVAGIFVLRGGYHAPTESERHDLNVDVAAPATVAA